MVDINYMVAVHQCRNKATDSVQAAIAGVYRLVYTAAQLR